MEKLKEKFFFVVTFHRHMHVAALTHSLTQTCTHASLYYARTGIGTMRKTCILPGVAGILA